MTLWLEVTPHRDHSETCHNDLTAAIMGIWTLAHVN